MIGGSLALLLAGAAAALPALRETRREPITDQLRRKAPGRFANLPRGRTHYMWAGASRGPVAVCIHGLTTPSFVWHGLAPLLGQLGFRVLLYDLYGRGYSDRPRGAQDAAFFADQLDALLEQEAVDTDITLIGYSMGGAIAAAYAAENAFRLRRLILIAPAGMGHDLGALTRFATDWPLVGDWAFHMAYPSIAQKAIEAERHGPSSVPNIADLQHAEFARRGYLRSVLSSLRYMLRRDLEEEHKRIPAQEVPVLAIWGRDDTIIPISAMGQLTQWNRNARQHVIEGAGHGLVFSHSLEVAEAIRDAVT